MANYSRTSRQPKHDVGSCIIDTLPNIALSYGYLKPTKEHPVRVSYTINRLKTEAHWYIKEGLSFQDFQNYVDRVYVNNPDFVWNRTKKILFEAHMEQLKNGWPIRDF